MSDFKTIETQEALDAIIKERLNRAEEKWQKQYEGFLSNEDVTKLKAEYEKQLSSLNASYAEKDKAYADFDKIKPELEAKVATYETNSVKMRVAHETGLPYEMANRLTGSNEEEIKKDAESLVKLIGNQSKIPPLANHDVKPSDAITEAYKKMAKGLKGE